jgi:hypothetical protein
VNGTDCPIKFRSSVTGLVTLVDPYQLCIAPLKPERTAAPSEPSETCHAALWWEKLDKKPGRVAALLGLLHHISQGTHALGIKPSITR